MLKFDRSGTLKIPEHRCDNCSKDDNYFNNIKQNMTIKYTPYLLHF